MDSLFDMVQDPVLRGLFKYLNREEVSKELEAFLTRYCHEFTGNIGEDLSGEQGLKRYDVYTKYVSLLDRRMKAYCKEEGLSQKEVYALCVDACEPECKDELTSAMLDMLVSATQYQSFCLNFSSFKRFRDLRLPRESKSEEEEEGKFQDDGFESKYDDSQARKK